MHPNRPEGLFKARFWEWLLRVSGSVGLGQGLIMCISSKFPGDVGGAVPRPHCENHCLGLCHPWGSGTVGTPSWQPHGDLGTQGEPKGGLVGIPVMKEAPEKKQADRELRRQPLFPSHHRGQALSPVAARRENWHHSHAG